MDKEKVYETLKNLEKNSIVSVEWDRGNGKLEGYLRFEGFDEKGPILYLTGKTRFDIEKIGGYNSIISVQEECPDGYCVRRGNCSDCDIGHTC